MTEQLTPQGYSQTKEKLAWMEARLLALRGRTDLPPSHKAMAVESYEKMIRQFRKEIKLYEAKQATSSPKKV
jgi:hypothetical protein